MTILAAEAGDAVAARATGTAPAFRSRSGTAPPRGGASPGRYPAARSGGAQPRTGGRTQQGSRPGGSFTPRPPSAPAPSLRQPARSGRTAAQAYRAVKPSNLGGPEGSSYEFAILAEFVLAVLLVSATPFARKGKQGLSPYEGQDMIQILALGLVYFLLSLAAGVNRSSARFAAWFGLLILLVVGLAEAAGLVMLFGPKAQAAAAAQQAAGQPAGTTTYQSLVAPTGGNPIQFTGGTVQGGHGR